MAKSINKKTLLFLACIFLIGCNASTTSNTNQAVTFTGTDGLVSEFSTNAPAKTVFEKSNFPILIKIRNAGAYSIPSDPADRRALISIGREKDYVPKISIEDNSRVAKNSGPSDNELIFFVDGRSQINPNGDELIASLTAQTSNLDSQSERRISTLTASICYPYKTTLSTTICIDPDIEGLRPGKKACKVSDQPFNSGQGAPIAITKIETQMLPELDRQSIKPQFLIYVENKGNGNPVNIIGFREACGKDFDTNTPIQNRWNVASLKAFTPNPNGNGVLQLICCPNQLGYCPDKQGDITDVNQLAGFIRLRDNKDFVRCTFQNGIPKNYDAYTSPLSIEIDYGYMQTISANFIIQKPLKY